MADVLPRRATAASASRAWVEALRVQDGTTRWHATVGAQTPVAVQVAGHRVVVVLPGDSCTGDGDVVAVDATSGRGLWRARLADPRYASTYAVDRSVVALASGDSVTGVDAKSGATRWVAKDLPPTDIGRFVSAAGGLFVVEKRASPPPHPGAPVEGPPSAVLVALDASHGQPRWTYTPDPSEEVLSVVGDGRVIVVESFGPVDSPTPVQPTNKLVALDSKSGQPLWHQELGSWESTLPLTARNGVVVFSGQTSGASRTFDTGSRLVALSSTTGSIVWDRTGATAIPVMTRALADGSLYLSAMDGTVEALDATTGSAHWQRQSKSGGGAGSSLLEAAGSGIAMVVQPASTRSVTVGALDARDGHARWHQSMPATAAAISHAFAYVAGGGERQHCD
jgi:outer membrane protein assembly factor BamB